VSSFRLSARRLTDRSVKVVNVAGQLASDRGESAVTTEDPVSALALVEPGPGRVARSGSG
jgi:hypothetical protein